MVVNVLAEDDRGPVFHEKVNISGSKIHLLGHCDGKGSEGEGEVKGKGRGKGRGGGREGEGRGKRRGGKGEEKGEGEEIGKAAEGAEKNEISTQDKKLTMIQSLGADLP